MERLLRKHGTKFFVATGVILAVLRRFIQDDAYISFRYARNLADGLGLVWNAGEYVKATQTSCGRCFLPLRSSCVWMW